MIEGNVKGSHANKFIRYVFANFPIDAFSTTYTYTYTYLKNKWVVVKLEVTFHLSTSETHPST